MNWFDDLITTIFLWPRRTINSMSQDQLTKIYSDLSNERYCRYKPIFK